jgi:inner membrane protein
MESRFNRMMKGAGTKLPSFSVSLVQPVDHYQLNERAAKYALLFIGLTFISFFMFELLKGLRVHPISTRWWAWGWPSSIWCCWR